ncbi:MAG TPA: hypothetical protein VGK75_19100 [Casimicrobiaceae bacterium]
MARHRLLLIGLLLWALVMIVPDLARVAQPLGSFGFYANNDGLIYDVAGPFPDVRASPAWKAGIREGDRIDLARMRCLPYDAATCGTALAVLGGVQYVLLGRSATISLVSASDPHLRQVTLVAEETPTNWLARGVLVLDEIAGILVVLAAAWLVWTRPGRMSWGFFLYVIWFNPGQGYVFYALLQQWPLALLAQNAAACLAQAAGFAGLLQFALRVPANEIDPAWRSFERALPLVAVVFAMAFLASFGSVLGYGTENITRMVLLAGFAVDLCALIILFMRRRSQTPEDYQRVRWVIWGCLIGLPAFLIADISQFTTLLRTRWGDFTPPEDVVDLLYLVNGILCLFVFEAIRKSRVVSVAIPLRRVTILGLVLSIPALLLHHEVDSIREHLDLPSWAWLGIGAALLFLISRLHETTVHLVDRYFNRALDRIEARLEQAIARAGNAAAIDRLLADEPFRAFRLASAATFRRTGAIFRRYEDSDGWVDGAARTLRANDPMLAPLLKGAAFNIGDDDSDDARLPSGLRRPVLAVPVASRFRCFAVALYGPHASGTDLDSNERAMLARLGDSAADAYAQLEDAALRARIAALEHELSKSRRADK